MAEEKKGIISCELIDLLNKDSLNKDPVLQFSNEVKEGKEIPNIIDVSEESLRRNRFLPSSGATRAMRRDLEETGLLPADALRIIKEFAIGK